MTTRDSISAEAIRAAFSVAMSSMYRDEVPLYGELVEIVQKLNADALISGRGLAASSLEAEELVRLYTERHGAIRLGPADELSLLCWIFLHHFGLSAQQVRTGCCGMAGMFRHQQYNAGLSRRLFDLSWAGQVDDSPFSILATGFSCRQQIGRYSRARASHPIEALSNRLQERGAA